MYGKFHGKGVLNNFEKAFKYIGNFDNGKKEGYGKL